MFSSEKRGNKRDHADAPHVISEIAELALLEQPLQKDDAEIADDDRNDHADQIRREIGPLHARLDRLDERKEIRTEHGGNAHEQRVFHCERTGLPGSDAGGDGAAGAGNAGDGGDSLRTADQQRIADAHRALVAAARNNAVGNIEQTAVEQERRADEAGLIIELLQRIVEWKNDKKRQRAEKEHQQHPRAGALRALLREGIV